MDERRTKTETPRGRLADGYRALLDNEKYKDFIVYTKSKPHGFSLGKQIICAPSSVLDELEEKIKSIEEHSNSIARPGTKPVKVKYQRFANTSSHALSITATKHSEVCSVEQAHNKVLGEIAKAELLYGSRNVEDDEDNHTDYEYEKFVEFISQFSDDVAIPVAKVSGSSYKVLFYDKTDHKRKSCFLNNLVMFEQTEDEAFKLAQTVQRKQRSDAKRCIHEAYGLEFYEPLSMTYEEYKELRPSREQNPTYN